jgi:hypothetical protein
MYPKTFCAIVIGVSWDATIAGQKMHGQTLFDDNRQSFRENPLTNAVVAPL